MTSRILIAGGGGFVGSHLSRAACSPAATRSSPSTTSRPAAAVNVAHLARPRALHAGRARHHHAVPGRRDRRRPFDAVLDLASPASPVDFATMPLEILAVGSTGTRNLLDLARRARRPVLPRLDQRGVRRSAGAPAARDATGATSARIGPRSCYDEAKRFSEAITMAYHRVARPRGADRAHLQHLRRADAPGRRPGRQHLHRAGAARRADHAARRRHADAQLLPRRRRDRRPGRRARRPPHRARQRRQPGRVHDARARRAGDRADRIVERDRHACRCPPSARATRCSAGPTSR